MNIVLLTGRLTQDVEIKEHPNGNYARINLAVRREFKNSDGSYDTDFIPVYLWEGAAITCKEFCKKGSMITIKCRVQSNKWEVDGKMNYSLDIIGEKISLI